MNLHEYRDRIVHNVTNLSHMVCTREEGTFGAGFIRLWSNRFVYLSVKNK